MVEWPYQSSDASSFTLLATPRVDMNGHHMSGNISGINLGEYGDRAVVKSR